MPQLYKLDVDTADLAVLLFEPAVVKIIGVPCVKLGVVVFKLGLSALKLGKLVRGRVARAVGDGVPLLEQTVKEMLVEIIAHGGIRAGQKQLVGYVLNITGSLHAEAVLLKIKFILRVHVIAHTGKVLHCIKIVVQGNKFIKLGNNILDLEKVPEHVLNILRLSFKRVNVGAGVLHLVKADDIISAAVAGLGDKLGRILVILGEERVVNIIHIVYIAAAQRHEHR